jgi:trans-aconitate 2-methyltransferase
MSWDPAQYLKFEAERARPFDDLIARVEVPEPKRVVDLGCGPGNVTATLLERWPGAQVHGVDSSTEMIAKAAGVAGPRLSFSQGDIESWRPEAPVDVIVSNAALQWVPGHVELLPRWIEALRPGGALAFQVPSNVDGDAAQIFRTVATSARWAGRLSDAAASYGPSASGGVVRPTTEYVNILGGLGARVDAWESTYFHLLPGQDPVLEWYAGTGLRPYLDVLDPAGREEFRAEVARELRSAFPARDYGTVLPFRRVFVIAYPRHP